MVVVHAVGPPIYEAFWLLCGIVDHVPARNVPTQAASMQIIQMIEKEDEELYNHLTRFKQCSMEQLVERWYRCWFACVFVVCHILYLIFFKKIIIIMHIA